MNKNFSLSKFNLYNFLSIYSIRTKVIVLFSIILYGQSEQVYAQICCRTNSIVINTGRNPATGATIAPGASGATGVPDGAWRITAIDANFSADISTMSLTPVPIDSLANVVVPNGLWTANPMGVSGGWINCFNGIGFTKTTGGPYPMTISREFRLCDTATIVLNLNMASDNCIVNINVDGGTPFGYTQNCSINNHGAFDNQIFVTTTAQTVGTHIINVTIEQDFVAGNFSGVNIFGTVSTISGLNALISEDTACVNFNCPIPSISGGTVLCEGSTLTLSGTPAGGSWSSSASGIATVSAGGVVYGVNDGTATITYTDVCGLFDTHNITVNPLPAAISGTLNVCIGSTTTLTSTSSGGTWSSGATGVATINSSGIVTGISNGTARITYTLPTGCFDTAIVTVNSLPTGITGVLTMCVGNTTTLNCATTGGTWSSGNLSIATVNASSGIVTGIAWGTAVITYKVTATGCYTTTVVTVNPIPGIFGTLSVCVGKITSLGAIPVGGAWSSSPTGIGTIGSSDGIAGGISAGTATITYTSSDGCVTTAILTVNPLPDPIGLAPPALLPVICVNATITLTNSTPGGTWSSANTAFATVGSATGVVTGISEILTAVAIYYTITATGCSSYIGIVVVGNATGIVGDTELCVGSSGLLTGVGTSIGSWSSTVTGVATINASTGVITGISAGTTTISYGGYPTCPGYVTKIVTVYPMPAAITGPMNLCLGDTAMLSNSIPGGIWYSDAPTLVSIDSITGQIIGLAVGGANISYTISGICSTTAVVFVNPPPDPITGTLVVCTGATTTLSSTSLGGTWSSSTPAVGTIGSTGVITGIAVGTTMVTYTLGTGCFTTAVVTVLQSPAVISGLLTVCSGDTTTLTNTTPGGIWSSSTPGVATITPGGHLTGISFGTSIITYTASNGCVATAIITVNALPQISGDSIVCTGLTTTLSSDPSGGTWSSSSPLVATVNAATGIVTGLSSGTTVITCILSTGCLTTIVVTVYTSPGAIAGDLEICEGEISLLTNTLPGGTWSSGTPGVATIGTDGTVTGIADGTTTITYTVDGGCIATAIVTINPVPVITGDFVVCTGDTVMLGSDIGGGSWTSSVPSTATVNTSGVVTGITAGTTEITYTLPTGCFGSAVVTVNETPTPIIGPLSVCEGMSVPVSDATAGGTWSSSVPSVATIGTSGVVTGLSAGTTTISYIMASGCFASAIFTVYPLPSPIDGTFSVCVDDSVTLVSLTSGGTWSSADLSIATVGSLSGVVTGIAAGEVFITYTLPTGCYLAIEVTVNPLPSPILGPSSVCVEFTIYLSDTTAGGTWSGSAPGIATFDPTFALVGGVSPGTIVITYTIATGCYITHIVTVNPVPTVTGDTWMCLGDTATLVPTIPGGSWSSTDPSVATIGSSSGFVTALSVGVSGISYILPTGCFTVTTVNVNPLPDITGTFIMCMGDTSALSATPSGGLWTSTLPGIATIGSISGVVTGIAGGTTTISYTSAAGCTTTMIVTIGPVIPPITSSDTELCVGDTLTVSNTTTGGTWTSSDDGIATVDLDGVVTGISTGSVTISYTVTDTCGTTTVTYDIDVLDVPVASSISGILGVCSSHYTTLSATPGGGTWSSSNPAIASVDAATGIVNGITGGSATITYTVTNICGSDTNRANVLVNMAPYITTNFVVACQTLVSPATDMGPDPVISGSTECIKVCDGSTVRYYANGVAGSAFTWDITGGTVVADYHDSIDVLWTTVGLTGSIVLHDTFHHCIDSARVCIKVIDGPTAKFLTTATSYCLNDNVLFTDLSAGDPLSPIVYWHWNFGDGFASSAPGSASHTYTTSGVYTVTLTVRNLCNCTDSFKMVLDIGRYENPNILCPAIVCDSEIAVYTTSARCDKYVWTVTGGTIIIDPSDLPFVTFEPVSVDSPTTTIVSSTILTSISVRWDMATPGGFGYVTLYTPECSRCDAPTTIEVPVILLNPVIAGRDTICTSEQVAYSLPLWPATDYEWGVLGYPDAITACRSDHKAVVTFFTPGTYTIHATYQNRIKLCGGNLFKVITVLPPSAIMGPLTVCIDVTETYSLTGSYSGDWTVISHLGSVESTSSGSTPSFSQAFPVPGVFMLTATGDFCASPVTVTVLPLPAHIDTLIGADTVCLNRLYTYNAGSILPGNIFSWTAIGGIVSPATGSNIVTVQWTDTGTKQLNVRRISTTPPYCPGPDLVMYIIGEEITPNVTGAVYPCANSYELYSSNYTRGEVYDWAIYPNTVGSVVSGNHEPDISILWNDVAVATTASVVATIRKCDSIVRDTLVVTISGSPNIAITFADDDTTCGGYNVSFNATSGAGSYVWDYGDGTTETTSTNFAAHVYSNTTAAALTYTATVTPGSAAGPCMLAGVADTVITVLPSPTVSLHWHNPGYPCPGDTAILEAQAYGVLSITSYSWTGVHGPVNDTIYHATDSDWVFVSVTASNGCTATSEPWHWSFNCDSIIPPCLITATATATCGTITLTATTTSGGHWVSWDELPGHLTNPAVFSVPSAGVYRYVYWETDPWTDSCRSNMVSAFVYAVPAFRANITCGIGGIDNISLFDYTSVLPGIIGYTAAWEDLTSGTAVPIPGGTFTAAAGSDNLIRLTITGTQPDGVTPINCFIEQNVHVPDLLTADFTYTVSPVCEKVPIRFTPVTTGSPVYHHWDFADGASLLLVNAEREYTYVGPFATNLWDVVLTVRDSKGCIATALQTMEIHPNLLDGDLGEDTTVCSSGAPVTLVYFPAPFSSSPVTYLWSTEETTPTINIYQSGAYWVTVFDGLQCQRTRPIPDALNVRVIQTPPAAIHGPRHYCIGDVVKLNGYVGDSVDYEWFRDGASISTSNSIADAGLDTGTYEYQLVIRVYDIVSATFCFDTSTIDTIRIYPLPAPPTIVGPDVINCDLYSLQLTATSPVSGTFNWSDGSYGPSNVINRGGPYRVWFTDLHGCKSQSDINVPLDPGSYKPYFPNGCYEICQGQLPLLLNGPPCASFYQWAWANTSGIVSIGGPGEMAPYYITADDKYYWLLNNGLCRKTIGTMNLSTVKCDKCQGVNLTATLTCDTANPRSYTINVSFNTTHMDMTYVLGTDIGPISPFTGTLASIGSHSATLTFTTLVAAPLPDSVTVQLNLTTADGLKCYEKITIALDTCWWVAERGSASNGDVIKNLSVKDANDPVLSAMLVFPNPSSGDVTVQYDYGTDAISDRMLLVYDALGRKMEQVIPDTKNGTWLLKTSDWASGMYIIRMNGNGNTLQTQRMVVVH